MVVGAPWGTTCTAACSGVEGGGEGEREVERNWLWVDGGSGVCVYENVRLYVRLGMQIVCAAFPVSCPNIVCS